MPYSAAYTKYAPKLSEGGMKVWGIKERWSPDYLYVVGCLDLPEHCAALILLWLHLVEIVLTSQHNWECCQKNLQQQETMKRCRNGVPKRTQTKENI